MVVKTDTFIDFSVGASGDVPASVKGYITYFNQEADAALGHPTPSNRLEMQRATSPP